MKVLYFSRAYTPHDHRFLKAISEAGHETFHLQLEPDARPVEDRPIPAEVRRVQWEAGRHPFRWGQVPARTRSLRRILREVQPDIVHAGPIQTCAFLPALAGFHPLLSMSWGYDLLQDAQRGGWWEWVTRYTLRRSDGFVSDAQVTRGMAVGFGMDPGRTTVFPWGVDLEHFAPEAAQDPEVFTLFCSRTWEPLYGVDVLVRAFAKIAPERPELRLILLGGGSGAGALRGILMNAGLLERVWFGGNVPQRDLPGWYHRADLYISPSHVDGSSVSLMEALACGLPALVSDIPGNREWVREGENGWLFRDGDVDVLAAKILRAMEGRASLPAMGRRAREEAEARADWKKNAAILLRTYESVQALKRNG